MKNQGYFGPWRGPGHYFRNSTSNETQFDWEWSKEVGYNPEAPHPDLIKKIIPDIAPLLRRGDGVLFHIADKFTVVAFVGAHLDWDDRSGCTSSFFFEGILDADKAMDQVLAGPFCEALLGFAQDPKIVYTKRYAD